MIPDWEDPLEEKMATHSSILAWRIPGKAAREPRLTIFRSLEEMGQVATQVNAEFQRVARRDKKAFLN